MEGIRAYLESSTVHGLSYIASTKRYVRIFWILVVIAGFSGATYLIYESFLSWKQNPISTTIETLPMSLIKFPKVTVCPPKNTFTDMNKNVISTQNFSGDFVREGLDIYNYAVGVIDDHIHTDYIDKLQEEDRFYNWYNGFTQITQPYDRFTDTLYYNISTTANSGIISTQYFGDRFLEHLLDKEIKFEINIFPPRKGLKKFIKHFSIPRKPYPAPQPLGAWY